MIEVSAHDPVTVFGPLRPYAAVAAIAELRRAELACAAYSWIAPPPVYARLARARRVRAAYTEYGDSFRGH